MSKRLSQLLISWFPYETAKEYKRALVEFKTIVEDAFEAGSKDDLTFKEWSKMYFGE